MVEENFRDAVCKRLDKEIDKITDKFGDECGLIFYRILVEEISKRLSEEDIKLHSDEIDEQLYAGVYCTGGGKRIIDVGPMNFEVYCFR
jgi:hypothetical protein